MKTKISKVYSLDTEEAVAALCEAAEAITSGGLCAFPTETVYGLGADAFNETAVAKIYKAKGRPQDNPCILHICDRSQLCLIAQNIPDSAYRLMDAFWPGPLTVILEKNADVPGIVSGGLPTVAVRMPMHPVARALIKQSGTVIAAPSANISGKPSTTKASHVIEDMTGKADVIIDGGQSDLGLESTIITFCGEGSPRLLRPGSITKSEIEAVIGRVNEHIFSDNDSKPEAPGMKYTHYSPKARVILVRGEHKNVSDYISLSVSRTTGKNGILCSDDTESLYEHLPAEIISAGKDIKDIARNLFDNLRRFDGLNTETVYSEGFYGQELGISVMNRLEKAASEIIEV